MCHRMMDVASVESDRLHQAMERDNATFREIFAEEARHMERDYEQGERLVATVAEISQTLRNLLAPPVAQPACPQVQEPAPGPRGGAPMLGGGGAGPSPGTERPPHEQPVPPVVALPQQPPPVPMPCKAKPPLQPAQPVPATPRKAQRPTPPRPAQPVRAPTRKGPQQPAPPKPAAPVRALPRKAPQQAAPPVPIPQQWDTEEEGEGDLTPDLVGYTQDLQAVGPDEEDHMPDPGPLTPGQGYHTPDLDQLPPGQGSYTMEQEQAPPTPEQGGHPGTTQLRRRARSALLEGEVAGTSQGVQGTGRGRADSAPPVLMAGPKAKAKAKGKGQGRASCPTPPATGRRGRGRANTAPSVLSGRSGVPGQVPRAPGVGGPDVCRSPPAKVGRLGARGRAKTM